MPTDAKTTITCTCDNPKCGGTVQWVQEDVAASGDALDEGFYRLIRVVVWDSKEQRLKEYTFDTKACAIWFFDHAYITGISPKECVKRFGAAAQTPAPSQEPLATLSSSGSY